MTTVNLTGPVIAQGVHDLTADEYHADPVPGGSLSSSGARKLLPPNCPARFRWEQSHRPAPKPQFDLGHAAHKLVLGAGPELVRTSAEEWRTNAVKKEVADARASGAVPLRPSEHDTVHAMADTLAQHPVAGALFNADGGGKPEQTLVWLDEPTGVWRRAMLDWLPAPRGSRIIVPDYKTTVSAAPAALARSVLNFGYHQQAAWYLDGIRALDLDNDPAFVFVAQEKVAPYLVTVFQLDETALRVGRELNTRALEIYRDCTASGVWPGYCTDVETIALPRWAERQHEESHEY